MTILVLALMFFSAPLLVLAGLSRHEKSATGTIRIVGERAISSGDLSPEGFVIVSGELCPAVAANGGFIADGSPVIVTGSRSIRLEVLPDPTPLK